MPKIGKNVLENLTRGMYEDSRVIYREYIQNAAGAGRLRTRRSRLRSTSTRRGGEL